MVSTNIFSSKLFLMIIIITWNVTRVVTISKNHKIAFFGIQDQEFIIKPYLKVMKISLKIIYYSIQLGIDVSIIAKCWIFSK